MTPDLRLSPMKPVTKAWDHSLHTLLGKARLDQGGRQNPYFYVNVNPLL